MASEQLLSNRLQWGIEDFPLKVISNCQDILSQSKSEVRDDLVKYNLVLIATYSVSIK